MQTFRVLSFQNYHRQSVLLCAGEDVNASEDVNSTIARDLHQGCPHPSFMNSILSCTLYISYF